MIIHARPSTTILVEGKPYRIVPTVANVMRALEALDDEDLVQADRLMLAVEVLFRRPYPREYARALDATFAAINEPSPYRVPDKGQRGLDYEQDANLIIAAFRQVYGIDLQRDAKSMDWRVFRALLSGITTDTQLGQIIDIRTRDIPKYTKHNGEMIREMHRLRAEYAVRPRKGQAAMSYDNGLKKFAMILVDMAGGETNG